MKPRRTTTLHQKPTLRQTEYLIGGIDWPFLDLGADSDMSEATLRQCWETWRTELLALCAEHAPGSRPRAWWIYEHRDAYDAMQEACLLDVDAYVKYATLKRLGELTARDKTVAHLLDVPKPPERYTGYNPLKPFVEPDRTPEPKIPFMTVEQVMHWCER